MSRIKKKKNKIVIFSVFFFLWSFLMTINLFSILYLDVVLIFIKIKVLSLSNLVLYYAVHRFSSKRRRKVD